MTAVIIAKNPTLDAEALRDLVDGFLVDESGFVLQQRAKSTGQGRWQTFKEAVIKRIEDQTYWRVRWSVGSTELQDSEEDIEIVEQVFPVQQVETKFVSYEQAKRAEEAAKTA